KLKSIIMLANMKDDESVKKIQLALAATRVDFTIDLEKQIVVVDGDIHMVNIAKRIILDQGFVII
ncbi:MAG: hypothetical protein K2F55_02625, partial [Erysipelotrichaceae bacterium]|nr:hypothetical protein [Erysipelotrichaceae bacterium]